MKHRAWMNADTERKYPAPSRHRLPMDTTEVLRRDLTLDEELKAGYVRSGLNSFEREMSRVSL